MFKKRNRRSKVTRSTPGIYLLIHLLINKNFFNYDVLYYSIFLVYK